MELMGVDNHGFILSDIPSLDPDFLPFLPAPIYAVVFLFPLSDERGVNPGLLDAQTPFVRPDDVMPRHPSCI